MQKISQRPYSKFNSRRLTQPFPERIFVCKIFGIDSLSKNRKCPWIQVDGHLEYFLAPKLSNTLSQITHLYTSSKHRFTCFSEEDIKDSSCPLVH